MTWEEYENSDWYKESHPDWNYRPTREEQIENEMRAYLDAIDDYRENDKEKDDELVEQGKIVRYVTTKCWNCRVRGLLSSGTFEQCRMRMYDYNVSCIGSEWEHAGIERIVADNEDELEEIINGYIEEAIEYDMYGDYDYDY